jgi:hypothetical protein
MVVQLYRVCPQPEGLGKFTLGQVDPDFVFWQGQNLVRRTMPPKREKRPFGAHSSNTFLLPFRRCLPPPRHSAVRASFWLDKRYFGDYDADEAIGGFRSRGLL